MLCAAISCWARLFLQHLKRRSLWIIRDTDDRWIPRLKWNFSDCSVVLRFVFLTQQQRLDCVDVFMSMRTASAAAGTHVLHSYRFLILSTLLNGVKVSSFAWHTQRQNSRYFRCPVWKSERLSKQPTWKLKHANSILESSEYFCHIWSKSIHTISSYNVSKLCRFRDTV